MDVIDRQTVSQPASAAVSISSSQPVAPQFLRPFHPFTIAAAASAAEPAFSFLQRPHLRRKRDARYPDSNILDVP